MASSVFFKFKSQKEPTRVEFDGTGISVFELKREIINKSGLGDGTDFDLFIYTDDNSEEYDDDTTIIPRSTTVIARRQPALKPGAGRAARYVSGKMPVSAKNASRKEQLSKASSSKPSATAISEMNNAMTEAEKMAAMFAAQTEQWSAQQEEMSHQAPVFKPGAKKPANVPDHDPPQGYICYRCGNKGHWIQLCPTNDDPDFDNRPRVKRTTGIPRSFLQKVDKSVVLAHTDGDESKRPSGIMVNAEGDFVIAEPDKASWEQYQAKAKSSTANKEAQAEDQEVQDRGLQCSIDKKMFIEPMKTPCCKKTFCNDCITNALIESDFVCPACQTEGVLIDDLQPDDDASRKIQEYIKEKETAKSTPPASPKADDSVSENDSKNGDAKAEDETKKLGGEPSEKQEEPKATPKSPTPPEATVKSPTVAPEGETQIVVKSEDKQALDESTKQVVNVKKRPADDFLENPKIPKAPKAMQNQQNKMNAMNSMMNGMPNMAMPNMMFNGMGMMPPNMMGMPGMNMNMNMGMPNMMGMPMMGMPNFGNMNGGFGMNGSWDMSGMNGMGNMGNMGGMAGMAGMGSVMNGVSGMNGLGGSMGNMGNMNGVNGFQNGGQTFGQQSNQADDDAYFRKPVNPHRHQNKQRRIRPSDYREL
ncbi:retinoblastoma-binding protein [Metarhizium album ARSEF 1941]|uniref:Retinoblastoma-binding protein n=1 Tax=Metarhizium album (strain ARSEF 1941) TaxID=1081103 RepID=A0A0B2WKV7_METAS|nr:retinoblastoma-binding protein [Metarhizium album ARSEF 1941]KHN94279.1 retinoblastoma-binding protein [Metarhizium album ARSEF 1941]